MATQNRKLTVAASKESAKALEVSVFRLKPRGSIALFRESKLAGGGGGCRLYKALVENWDAMRLVSHRNSAKSGNF
jgi:hypothetical protein